MRGSGDSIVCICARWLWFLMNKGAASCINAKGCISSKHCAAMMDYRGHICS